MGHHKHVWQHWPHAGKLFRQTGQQQIVTHKTKYFTPDISADGLKVAAVQINSNGKSELHIINASKGEVIQSIHSSEINLFTDPKFIDDNSVVTAVRLNDGKMALRPSQSDWVRRGAT